MKKLLPLSMVLLLILCTGCRKAFSPDVSADAQSDCTDSTEYIYDDSDSVIEDIVGAIESDLNEKENAGKVTVSRETSTYSATDGELSYSEPGKHSAVIDGGISQGNIAQIEQADINTNGVKPLYYKYLTDMQKQIYRFMKSAAENMTEGFFSIGAVSSKESDRFSDITVAYRAMSSDNPQLFWLSGNYVMSSDGSSVAFSYHENGYNLNYNVSKDKRNSEQKKLYDVVERLTSQAKTLDSRFKKELFFHDWLCENVTYGTDGTQNSYTVYGALVNGTAVCEGYSRAMQLLCDKVGIPCTVVYGYSNGTGHMWNIINPGDGWYNLDITWDDDADYNVIRHSYFNVSDSVIKNDHEIFDAVKKGAAYTGSDFFNIHLYSCENMNYNYFNKHNLIFTDDTTNNVNLITDALWNGKMQIELMYANSSPDYNSVFNQLNSQLYQYGVYVSSYSNLGNSVVLWLTFLQ